MRITQYGYNDDPYMDSKTERRIGGWDNVLNAESCALTDAAVKLLELTQANRGAKLQVVFTNGATIFRRWDDRAPEANARLDLYQPQGFDKSLPDFATVTVVPDDGSTPAQPVNPQPKESAS